MTTLIIFLLILGVLVFVHELGHFLVARRNGVKADEFGFGFPPRLAGFVQDEKTKKYKFVWGNQDIESKNTIYSINWIPLGGFVRIKGENGDGANDPDSFASKKAWPRIKILAAGVIMNFILAWVIITTLLVIGQPQEVPENTPGSFVFIGMVAPDSPAENMGLIAGDKVLRICLKSDSCVDAATVSQFVGFINDNKGKEIAIEINRNNAILNLVGMPRENPPIGQGPLGVQPVQTSIVKYPWYEAAKNSVVVIFNFVILILGFLKNLIIGKGSFSEVSGPVGIFRYTGQVAKQGFLDVLNLMAVLSINLGIINILPIPALDGGRILFILIEKIKGSPVNQKTEQAFHNLFFILLLTLMAFISTREILGIGFVKHLLGH